MSSMCHRAWPRMSCSDTGGTGRTAQVYTVHRIKARPCHVPCVLTSSASSPRPGAQNPLERRSRSSRSYAGPQLCRLLPTLSSPGSLRPAPRPSPHLPRVTHGPLRHDGHGVRVVALAGAKDGQELLVVLGLPAAWPVSAWQVRSGWFRRHACACVAVPYPWGRARPDTRCTPGPRGPSPRRWCPGRPPRQLRIPPAACNKGHMRHSLSA